MAGPHLKLNSCNACKVAKSVPVKYIIMQFINAVAYKYRTQTCTNKLYYINTQICAHTRTHTHLGIMYLPYTSTYKLIPLRLVKSMDPCASVPITHRHKGRSKRIGNASPHSTKQKFQILHILQFSHSTHSPHTPYSPHPLRSTPTRAPTHICGVLTSLPRPVEGEEQP